jgi:hypothetical protein
MKVIWEGVDWIYIAEIGEMECAVAIHSCGFVACRESICCVRNCQLLYGDSGAWS